MIIKDSKYYNDELPSAELLSVCITEHLAQTRRLNNLYDYYNGEHDINNRTFSNADLPNNKIVCNHASYITDMAVGYVFGEPVQYSGEGSEELNEEYTTIDEDSHNNELALDLSIYGQGLEMLYMSSDDKPMLKLATMSPLNTFVVCDNTVDNKSMFAVNYNTCYKLDNTQDGYDVTVYTDKLVAKCHVQTIDSTNYEFTDITEHYFNSVPIIEYKNNKNETGDFENVISLIDAYNKLQSDRINDKEQLVDAILAFTGVSLGDNEGEMTATANALRKLKMLELPEGGTAQWLTKSLNETETEVLKTAIKQDIHEFSKVPNLTDENFASNASGVAMKYKLLGFEQLAKTKERYFKQGLRKRLALTSNIKGIQAKNINPTAIDITMKRSLPVDDELKAKIAQETEGFISWETRLQNFNPELDPEAEKEKLQAEKESNIKMQQQAFGTYGFQGGGVDEESEDKQEE